MNPIWKTKQQASLNLSRVHWFLWNVQHPTEANPIPTRTHPRTMESWSCNKTKELQLHPIVGHISCHRYINYTYQSGKEVSIYYQQLVEVPSNKRFYLFQAQVSLPPQLGGFQMAITTSRLCVQPGVLKWWRYRDVFPWNDWNTKDSKIK